MNDTQQNESAYDSVTVYSPWRKYVKYFLVGVLFLILLGVVTYGIFQYRSLVETEEDAMSVDQQELDDLYAAEAALAVSSSTEMIVLDPSQNTDDSSAVSGSLFFSGIREGDEGTQVFKIDTEGDMQVTRYFDDPQFSDHPINTFLYTALIAFDANVSPSKFFLSTVSHESYAHYLENQEDREMAYIHMYDLENDELSFFKNAAGYGIRRLDWSEEQQLLTFSRLTSGNSEYIQDILNIDNWEVVVFDTQADEVVSVIPQATGAQWSPDGSKILFLREDGLYVYNVATRAEEKVHDIADGATLLTSANYDISPNGDQLIWSTAIAGDVRVFDIVSWDEVALESVRSIKVNGTEFYWVKFSPDGAYFAVQTIDLPQEGEIDRNNPRMEIRSVETGEIVRSYPLDGFDFNLLFTDAWIAATSSASVEQ